MRKAIILAAAVLVSASVHATNYQWSAGAVSLPYDCATAWTPSGVPAGAGDSISLGMGASGATVTFPGSGTVTLGAITLDNGIMSWSADPGTIRLAAGSGQSGSLIIRGSGAGSMYGGNKTFDVDGDVRIINSGPYDWYYSSLIMRGAGKVHDMDYDPEHGWKQMTVADCASVSGGDGTGATVRVINLQVNGTITGGTWLLTCTGPNPTVKFGPGGAFTGGTLTFGSYDGTQNISLGGGTYYDIDTTLAGSTSGGYGTNARTTRAKGNLNVTRDFKFEADYSGWERNRQENFDLDNGGGSVFNLTVGRNFTMGGATPGNPNYTQLMHRFWARSGAVDIRGDARFDCLTSVQGGTSTWKFGGNVQFTSTFNFDNSNMKLTVVTVNGAGAQNLGFGQRLPLGSFVVNKPSGAATLTDNLLLTGSFAIDCGTFAPSTFYVNMKGGGDCLTTALGIDAHDADLRKLHIMAGSPSSAKLLSNLIVADNLDIDAGCKLFLNGFTLNAEGRGFSGEGTWAWDQGQIIGAAVPEPATLLLLGTGALAVLGYARRRRMA